MSRTALLKKTNIIAGVIVVVAAVAGAVVVLDKSPEQPQPSAQAVMQETSRPQTEARTDYVSYAGEDGKNALELLKAHADVKTESSSFGELVKSINNQDGGGKKYWTFYVNGEMAQVGAGAYETKSTDKIEWKLQ